MSAIYLNGTKLTGADNASNVVAQDVLGLVEQAGDDTTVQALLDEIADRVADKLLTKTSASSLYLPQSVQNVLGAKNLLPVTFGTTTADGITWTVNSDGTVSANGTASTDTYFYFNEPRNHPYPAGDYIVSQYAVGGENDTWGIRVVACDASGNFVRNITSLVRGNESKEFTVDYDGYVSIREWIYVPSGTVFSNKLFKPMLRPASYKDSTYEPYAITNRGLTAATTGTIAYNTTNCNGGSIKITRLGSLRIVSGYVSPKTTATSSNPITIATLSAGDYSDISFGARSFCCREDFATMDGRVVGGVIAVAQNGNIVYQGYYSGANLYFSLVFAV